SWPAVSSRSTGRGEFASQCENQRKISDGVERHRLPWCGGWLSDRRRATLGYSKRPRNRSGDCSLDSGTRSDYPDSMMVLRNDGRVAIRARIPLLGKAFQGGEFLFRRKEAAAVYHPRKYSLVL